MIKKTIILIMLILPLLVACGSKDEESSDLAITNAMETVQAKLTQMTKSPPSATSTSTTAPTLTLTPTVISSPTATTISNPNPKPVTSCDVAGFVADVTIPDGTEMAPNTPFKKKWDLRNDGTCTWTADYRLAFYSDESMGAPAEAQFTTGPVAPGETIRLSADLTAPSQAGHYFSYWVLRNASGVNFGIGAQGNPFYVEINVIGSGSDITPSTTITNDGNTFTSTPKPSKTPVLTPTSVPTLVPTDTIGPYP